MAIKDDLPDKTDRIRSFRRATAAYFADIEKRFDALLTGPKDASWLRNLWRAYKVVHPPAPPAIVSPDGAPLTPRQQAGRFLSLFASKHEASSSPEATSYTTRLHMEVQQLREASMRTSEVVAPIVTPVEVRTAIAHLNHAQWSRQSNFRTHRESEHVSARN